jgi:hypothetical protein
MGKHIQKEGVESGAFETVEQAVTTVREIADNMWIIAGACANDEQASEAVLELCRYLRIMLHDTNEGDPELVAYGLIEFVHELAVTEDETTPRRPAGFQTVLRSERRDMNPPS